MRGVSGIAGSADQAWTQFLDALAKIIIPDWNFVISLLPGLLVLALLGPILTLLALAWLHHLATRRRGRLRLAEVGPMPAALDAGGEPIVPPNVPYCPTDHLLYPGRAVTCEACRQELSVRCPVDERYVLAAASTALTVRRPDGPPAGGAAIA
jgi:hypothetical protein